MRRSLPFLFCAFFVACSKLPDPQGEGVSHIVQTRSGYDVVWDRKRPCTKEYVLHELLNQPVDVDTAVQIALLNSPQIQILFEEIGVAEADLIHASLIDNPVFGAALRFPNQNTRYWKTEMDLLQPLVSLFLLPLRKKVATLDWIETKSHVADEIFLFIENVRTAFFSLQEKMRNLSLQRTFVELMELKYLVARRQWETGATTPVQVDLYYADWQRAGIDLRSMETEKNRLWQNLTHLLGLSDFTGDICLDFPMPDERSLSLCQLQQTALSSRLDYLASRIHIEKTAQSFGLYDWWVYTESAAGISYEKETDGEITIGPGFTLSLPLFNHGQSDQSLVQAELSKGVQLFLDKQREIYTSVSASYENILLQQQQLHQISRETLPNNRDLIDQMIRLYNFMNTGVFALLDAKAMEVEVEMLYIQTLRDYWVEHAHLSRLVGGCLPC